MSIPSKILPTSLFQDLNQNHETIELPPPPQEEERSHAPTADPEDWDSPAEPGYDELNEPFDDDEEGLEAFADEIEGPGESGPMSIDEIESLAESAVDLLQASKDGLAEFYDSRFSKIIKRKFSEEKRLHLILVESLYHEDHLDIEHLTDLLKKTQDKSPEFSQVQLIDLLEVANDYKGIRRRYRSKPINDKVEAGIRRNMILVLRKHMTGKTPDPAFILGFYLVAAFAGDAVNIVSIMREEKNMA